MFSVKDNVSSKRVAGLYTLITIVTVIEVYVVASSMPWDLKVELLKTVFYGGLIALGITSVEKIFMK